MDLQRRQHPTEGSPTTLEAMEATVIPSVKALVDFWLYQTLSLLPVNKNGLYEFSVVIAEAKCWYTMYIHIEPQKVHVLFTSQDFRAFLLGIESNYEAVISLCRERYSFSLMLWIRQWQITMRWRLLSTDFQSISSWNWEQTSLTEAPILGSTTHQVKGLISASGSNALRIIMDPCALNTVNLY